MSTLSENLKKLRHKKRLTQIQVAEAVGISQGNYSAIEANKVEPSFATLTSLADFYGETLDTLTGFIRIVAEEEPLSVDESQWLDFYKKMSATEKSLALGVISVITKQRDNPYAFLPMDMDLVDWKQEQKKKSDDGNEYLCNDSE